MLLSNFNLLATAHGGVARLRELILTLAVQGKLVPQDPGDEPASVLLKKIRVEKDRLIAEGKIRRDKPLAVIADEEKPCGLPVGWKWVRLDEISTVIVDCPHSTAKFVSKGLLCIDTNSFKNGKLLPHKLRYVDEATFAERIARLEPQPGDLVFAREGSVGESIIIPDEIFACLGQRVMLFRFSEKVSNEFVRLVISSKGFLDNLLTLHKGIGAKHVNVGDMRLAVAPLPPLAEQSRIVTRVEELMRVCDALEVKGKLEAAQHAQLVSTLLGTLTDSDTPEALAENWKRIAAHFDLLLDRPQAIDAFEQTILQLAVRGLLVPQDPSDEPASVLLQKIRAEKDRLILEGKIKRDKPLQPIADEEKPFKLPAGWEWVRLNALLQKIGAGSTPLGGREVYTPSGVKFLRSQNVYDNGLRLHSVAFIRPETHAKMAGTVVLPNDLLFNITGASIGRCAVVPNDFDEANVSQHVTIVRPVMAALNAFLHKVLVSRHVQQAVMDVQVGVSREGLSIAKLGHFLIPVPPLAEQSRIVARVEELRCLCAGLRQRLSASQTTQAHLAEALVAG